MSVVSSERGHAEEDIETFLNQHFPGLSEKKQTQVRLLHRVQEGKFFGVVEVDIETPPDIKEKSFCFFCDVQSWCQV